jgi:uncharacterized protein YceK
MTMRRIFLVFVLVGALAGCSSGSGNVVSSAKSTTPLAATPTTPKATATTPKATASKSATAPRKTAVAVKVTVGTATSFCAAFKEMQSVKASDGAAAAGAAYQTIAAEMRKYAPTAIKSAAGSYADVIENSGKALKAGTLPTAMGGTTKDLAKVTLWVSKNCKR